MKHTNKFAALAAATVALAFAPVASAQTNVYWDVSGSTSLSGGSGTWDAPAGNSNKVWNTSTAGGNGSRQKWSNNTTTIANFTVGNGTVTLAANITANALNFTSGPYTVGNTTAFSLTLASGNITVANAVSATVSGPIAGSAGLNKLGAGTLTLSGTNTYTGTTKVTAGTLQVSGAGALPSNAVSLEGGTLKLGTAGTYTAGALSSTTSGTIDFGSLTSTKLTFSSLGSITGVIDVINYTYSAGTTYLRFTGQTQAPTSAFTIGGAAAAFNNSGDLVLLTAIPEPSSFALVGAVATLGFAATRRRRKA